MEWSVSDDVDDDVMALPGPACPALFHFFSDRSCEARNLSKYATDTTPIRFTDNNSFFVIFTRSRRRRIPASPSGSRIRAGISKSVNDAESSASMWSLYSSYMSKELSREGDCIIFLDIRKRGEPPPRQVKPINLRGLCPKWIIDIAKIMLYFRLSNTLRTASDAICGVTDM